MSYKRAKAKGVDLKTTFNEFHSIWMLQKLKRKRMENFEIQALRNVVKENGPDVLKTSRKILRKSK